MKKKKFIIYFAALIAAFVAIAIISALLIPLPDRLFLAKSQTVEFSDGSPMCVFLTPDEKWRIPARLDEIDSDYIDALLAYEDKRFYRHPGVDPFALARAFYQNVRYAKVVSGASTITMQLARMLEPRPRTVSSKLTEMFRAFQLELRSSKREILENYLNYLPFGKNVEGIEAASLNYFGHRASDLSPFEIAYLLGVPQDPTRRFPSPQNVERMRAATRRIARRLFDEEIFSKEKFGQVSQGEPLERILPFPRNAMHAAVFLSNKYSSDRIRSTIDRNVQSAAENALAAYRAEFADKGIHNASVVVIDNETSEVVAAVGNYDFWDKKYNGQVIGFLAPRSPGSTMKPFLYAIAIDRGLALPDYLIPDVPVKYGGYEPSNYDGTFRGLIQLRKALALSLNIPFVNLLKKIGVNEFITFLGQAGLSTLVQNRDYYGLSLAIGGVEVRLAELTNMYSMLARDGEFFPLKWIRDGGKSGSVRLLQPGPAYLTRQALRLRDRPDFPQRKATSPLSPDIFWKTGTSGGHRDAWAVGGVKRYTAGVWVGNFTGESNRNLVGSEAAGPILFDILQALSSKSPLEKDYPPDDLAQIDVCAFSGYPVGKFCVERVRAYAVKTRIPTETCPYHVEYTIDTLTGYRLDPQCLKGRKAESRIYTILPAIVRMWVADARLVAQTPPEYHPDCRHAVKGKGVTIVSPKSNAMFMIIPGLSADRQEIPLEADADSDVGEVYWFVDGEYLGAAAPHERIWLTPTPGKHSIKAVDPFGGFNAIKIIIIQQD